MDATVILLFAEHRVYDVSCQQIHLFDTSTTHNTERVLQRAEMEQRGLSQRLLLIIMSTHCMELHAANIANKVTCMQGFRRKQEVDLCPSQHAKQERGFMECAKTSADKQEVPIQCEVQSNSKANNAV